MIHLGREDFEELLRMALSLDLPYVERPVEPTPLLEGRAASVLILFGFSSGLPMVLITRRTDSVEHHKGQIAFPGGMSEPEELRRENGPVDTALRETEEEVGIPRGEIQVLGSLPKLWTVTRFWVAPIVGMLSRSVPEISLKINAAEIAETVWISLRDLLGPGTYRQELLRVGERDYPIHVFQVGNYRIWGATGSMLKNLLDRMRMLG